MTNRKIIAIIFSILFCQSALLAQQSLFNSGSRIFGLTIDESSFNEEKLNLDATQQVDHIIKELRILKEATPKQKALTVRVVLPTGCLTANEDCDPSEPTLLNKLDPRYLDLIKRIKAENLAYIMAELVDSDVESSGEFFKSRDKNTNVAQFLNRTKAMYSKLGNYVDIWEIGNEVNGDWYGGQVVGAAKNKLRRETEIAQLKAALDFIYSKKQEVIANNHKYNKNNLVPQTAITYYFSGIEPSRHSYENINDEMMGWIKSEGEHFLDNNRNKIKFTNLDYVLVSYYPDDNFYEMPNGKQTPIVLSPAQWVEMFATIQNNFGPDVKYGLGEMGSQCYFPKTMTRCEDCKTLLLDYDTQEKNPCNVYDKEDEVIIGRNCPCCYCAQVSVVKNYYTDLDKNIYEIMQNDKRFANPDKFIGGYFNWYYSHDVLNKMAVGSEADKAQALKVRNATQEAYKTFITGNSKQ